MPTRRSIPNAIFFVLTIAVVTVARPATETTRRPVLSVGDDVIHGGPAVPIRAQRDTVTLLGGPGRWDGRFETQDGHPAWHGWTHVDMTLSESVPWTATTYNAENLGGHGPGNHAMWCGRTFANNCAEGYGNNWETRLVWRGPAPDPAASTVVGMTGVFNSDTEPGYDYVHLQVWRAGGWESLFTVDGVHLDVAVLETTLLTPADYAGAAGDEIHLAWFVESDGAWSDEDCLWDTQGACQVDDLAVTLNGTPATLDDFEPGSPIHWEEYVEPGVGDFTHLAAGLRDADRCRENWSWQVCFIDDGDVVPGTGGTPCVTWCYGPGGYIVNNTGGLRGPDFHIHNQLHSPVLAMPEDPVGVGLGLVFSYEVFRHEPLSSTSPGMFYNYAIRSTAALDPAEIQDAGWQDRGSPTYYGGPDYIRRDAEMGDLVVSGARWVQVSLWCLEWGWVFGWEGIDGTPAPYFDNVAVKVYPLDSPTMTAREIDLAQDNFPERGILDLGDLASNSIRFDMARNISPASHLRNDSGDSIFVDLRYSAPDPTGPPRLHVRHKANALFDGFRALPPGFTLTAGNFPDGASLITGWVEGDSTFNPGGSLIHDRYNFDLPDTGYFYPGDVIHYHFEAVANVGGEMRTAILPADTSGWQDFADPLGYDPRFTVRGLPTVLDVQGNQPGVLFWNDFANRGGEAEWYFALANLGFVRGVDYDVYDTNGPTSGVGNGLGGRATAALLAGYDVLLYTSGDLAAFTLSNGDFDEDSGDDLGVVRSWLELGGKSAFLTGDGLVHDLATQVGAAGQSFVQDFLGVQFIDPDLSERIGGQVSPRVAVLAENGVLNGVAEWIAHGGCPSLRRMDAVEADDGTDRLAEFLDPAGVPGFYPYAAVTRHVDAADVILLPYDLAAVRHAPGTEPPEPALSVRAGILGDVLAVFGQAPSGPATTVPPVGALTVLAYPNPFNPRTTIALDLPRQGPVSVRLFDLRGRLVRTLHDGELAAGRHDLVWDGTDGTGRSAAAGVYFYELKVGGEERIGKLALVR